MTNGPTAPTEEGSGRGHFIVLDWLRFLAALMVVLCHVRPEHWVAWRELAPGSQNLATQLFFLLIRAGPEAVVIFFVLSGYLVGGKLIRRCMDGTFAPFDYFRDRASRIFTPLLPAILLTVACVWFLRSVFPDGFGTQLLGNIAQMQGILCDPLDGNAPLWSLSYEVWFYALGGALAVIATRRSARRTLVAMFIATVVAAFSAWCLLMLETTYLWCWVLGAIVYAFPPRNTGRIAIGIAILCALIGVGLSQATGANQGALIAESAILHKTGTLLLAASIAFLLPTCGTAGGRISGTRIGSLGPRLAAFSYTLYLTHYPLLLVMRTWHEPYAAMTANSLLLFVGKVVVCLAAAWLLHLPFERNTPAVRRWIAGIPFSRLPSAVTLPCAKS